jgi:hypothetical protein
MFSVRISTILLKLNRSYKPNDFSVEALQFALDSSKLEIG